MTTCVKWCTVPAARPGLGGCGCADWEANPHRSERVRGWLGIQAGESHGLAL
eukprot:CAMPEP_0174329542 /NCGR_PEP_ID=MMETSP0810-20121108/15927_1 /TAXON_ID=73025 ORGANISM="Eutreptiella gymnastica-like, Strain CCMP1594" /NCGR_SAMPLE_ID=MMETSP0810 /ASSEMBLY_ACC=CAM_ASM_000659 /LENGTH=51 /DNA_ID=CAMNT_0015444105 /DNA_START=561 /DNA_END=716 /DNA_ORIENTATION=-